MTESSPARDRKSRRSSFLFVGFLLCLMPASRIVDWQRRLIYFPAVGPVPLTAANVPPEHVQAVETTTSDGIILHGWYVTPDTDMDATDRWLTILFSGNGNNRSARTDLIQAWNDLGNCCLLCDYRGYGENSGKPSEAGLAADAQAVWTYAIEKLKFPAHHILIFGESLGGGVATRLAHDLCVAGTPPAALIVAMSFTSLADVAAVHYPWLPARWLLVDRYPSFSRISAITCPILILHGTQDPVIPFQQGQQLFQNAPENSVFGIPKTFLTLPGAGHDFATLVNPASRTAYAGLMNSLSRAGSLPE